MYHTTLVWRDIFDSFMKGMDEIKGRFEDDGVEYYFKGKWDRKNERWIVHFWVI